MRPPRVNAGAFVADEAVRGKRIRKRQERDKGMLEVWISEPQFEYDIHSLVKAFYPAEDVKVLCGSGEGRHIRIDFKEREISMAFFAEDGENIFTRGRIACEKDAERTLKKNRLKELIYACLSGYLKKELPWGTLTGIRPTKIPMTLLSEGKTEEEILSYMKETYTVSDRKGCLSIEVARREKELLSGLHYEDGYSLYIGIPFCPTTCLYCSFTSYPIGLWKKRVSEYLDALIKEIAYVGEAYKDRPLDTVYIGGGTPTTLEPEELDRLFDALEEHLDLSGLKELTVEAGRADSITRQKLQALKRHSVTRISVNPQTMKEETLKLIGRKHTVEQVREAFALAREEGFDNINMDIILGLPEETKQDVENTLEEIEKLGPDSLTVHSLAVKRASRLHEWIELNGISTLKNTDETMEAAELAARRMGMEPYYLYRQKNMSGNLENVGYASPGKYGIYNILIMEEKQTIMALGAGSISKAVYPDGRIERSDNVKDVGLYIERIDEMIQRKAKLFRKV